MSDPHDFDAWHADDPTADSRGLRYDEVEEVDAKDHDLWGFTDRTRRDDVVDRRAGASTAGQGIRPTEPAVTRRRAGRPEWFAPVLVMVLALFAFGGAWLLTRGGSTTTSTPPVSASVATATASSASAPPSSADAPASATSTDASSASASSASSPSSASSSSSSSSESSSSSASSSGSDTATAAAPADAVSTCGDGESVGDSAVKLGAGTHSSCPYIAAAVAQVRAHVAQDAGASSFSITPYSAVLERTIPLTCTRAQHLTECTGGNNVRFWVTG